MKENLIEIIKQYLNIETNYAIIINGSYGIGKTYFFKHHIAPEIKEISIPRDEQKKYIPIHISLFGLKTIEDIQTQIFCSIYPILKSKGIKLAAGIGKSIIRGLAQLNKLGDLDKYVADVDVSSSDWINYDELVLCFDDLDRKSDKLDIKDIFGFINTLVETDGSKIIIIANETILRKDASYTLDLREKVIGVSMEYFADISESYDSIIKERYSSTNKVYFKFLEENRDTIIDVIRKNENNLRNLIFFLEHFKAIYYNLINLFESDRDFKYSEKEKLKIVLDFSIAIAIEYKLGHLNTANFDEIKLLNRLILPGLDVFLRDHTDSKVEIKKTYIEEFKEKYYSKKSNYYYLDSIFSYMTGQQSFDIAKLKVEMNKLFQKDEDIPEEQKVLNQLGYFDCLELSSSEYRQVTNEMLDFVDKGNFQLDQYPTAFHFATRFDNVLRFNINNLKTRFKRGIKKGRNKNKFDNHLNFKLAIDENSEFKEDLREIIIYCTQINTEIGRKKEIENFNSFVHEFKTNIKEFIKIAQDPKHSYTTTPFFNNLSLNEVYLIINSLKNTDIIDLSFYFQNRYRINIYPGLYPEKDFLLKLKDRINSPQKRKIKNLRNATLDFLIKHIDESIGNFH